jgi:hypothetical protein
MNTLAYFASPSVAKKKGFITLAKSVANITKNSSLLMKGPNKLENMPLESF